MSGFSFRRPRRPVVLTAAAVAALSATAVTMGLSGNNSQEQALPHVAKEYLHEIQGVDEGDGAGGETKEIQSALAQYNNARNAPGFALQGGYTNAVSQMAGMSSTGGAWQEVTNVPYNSDDQRYRDYYANTTAGSGYVTGRVQALAADGDYLFAAGAAGGVYRKNVKLDGPWTSVSDAPGGVPALSSGALAYRAAPTDELWYATGDGSTGATTYTGDGVWVAKTASGAPVWTHLADGDSAPGQTGTRTDLFDGAVIQQLRFDKAGKWVYAPSSYGLWRHSTTDLGANWEPVFVPNPDSLPNGSTSTGTNSTDNYVTDVAIDPQDPDHVVAAFGWIAGGADNGWYDGHRNADGSWTFKKSNVSGAINPKDIGRTTFAWGGKKLYALVHNPDHAAQGVSYSELGGIYVSNSGSVSGPWTKIADSQKLAQAGSALDPTVGGAGSVNGGYQPGVQAWYNQFLAVDPKKDDHVFAGLEEVYETKNGGSNWTTPGPYWNFFFSCWGKDTNADQLGCNDTTHSDQHAVAIANGQLYVGNDGGIYTRPVDGTADSDGHATDWKSLSAPQTPDFLQYYAVGVGKVDSTKASSFMSPGSYDPTGVIVSGGLQDNGGSILFTGKTTEKSMGSNFGGDGGDVLVDPNDGCRIVQEYVDLTMRVTNDCAATSDIDSFTDPSKAHTRNIAPPETAARFTAPFAADHQDINGWVAAGRHVWLNTKGFNIAKGSDWQQLADLGTNAAGSAAHTATAVASDKGDAIVPFCGSCNPGGSFESGYAFGRADAAALNGSGNHGWQIVKTGDAKVVDAGGKVTGALPNRMIAGADVYHDSRGQAHYLLAFNGFSRRWVEGPGAGIGHLFESSDGLTWHDLSTGTKASTSLPDVPASTVKYLADGRIALGTDLGVFVRSTSDPKGDWTKLGTGLPATVVSDLEPGPAGDDSIYAGTYGRGIWKLALGSSTPHYAGGDATQDDYWNAHKPS